MCLCLFGCGSESKEGSKTESAVETTESMSDKIAYANEMAQKIADNSIIIYTEMEFEGKFLSGAYTMYGAGVLSGGDYTEEFFDNLKKSVPLPEKCKMEVSFTSDAKVAYVTYIENDSRENIGAYPDIVTVEEINNGATYDSILRDRISKATQ